MFADPWAAVSTVGEEQECFSITFQPTIKLGSPIICQSTKELEWNDKKMRQPQWKQRFCCQLARFLQPFFLLSSMALSTLTFCTNVTLSIRRTTAKCWVRLNLFISAKTWPTNKRSDSSQWQCLTSQVCIVFTLWEILAVSWTAYMCFFCVFCCVAAAKCLYN